MSLGNRRRPIIENHLNKGIIQVTSTPSTATQKHGGGRTVATALSCASISTVTAFARPAESSPSTLEHNERRYGPQKTRSGCQVCHTKQMQ